MSNCYNDGYMEDNRNNNKSIPEIGRGRVHDGLPGGGDLDLAVLRVVQAEPALVDGRLQFNTGVWIPILGQKKDWIRGSVTKKEKSLKDSF